MGQTVNSYGKSIMDQKGGKFDHMDDPFVELLTQLDKLQELGLNRVRFTSPILVTTVMPSLMPTPPYRPLRPISIFLFKPEMMRS